MCFFWCFGGNPQIQQDIGKIPNVRWRMKNISLSKRTCDRKKKNGQCREKPRNFSVFDVFLLPFATPARNRHHRAMASVSPFRDLYGRQLGW
jgi:hypothetical protein